MNKQLLVIGKPHSGKSTFLIQLYSKLITNKTLIKLYKPVSNISALTDGRIRLAQGKETTPTPPDDNSEIELPLQLPNEKVDLVCLDYGGEQVNRILTSRELNKRWLNSVKNSNSWLFFIRLANLDVYPDISNHTVSDEQLKGNENQSVQFSISDQTAFIELLQILLNAKGHNYHFKNSVVKLTIVLNCWDELKTKELPRDMLSKHLPLLLNFVEANWEAKKINFLGLSPQGFSLSDVKNQNLYKIEGPENFGYLIAANGKKKDDITELISEAL
jgi:hypothetical protein